MEHQGLAPGVKHRENADLDAELASSDIVESLADRAEQKIVEHAWSV